MTGETIGIIDYTVLLLFLCLSWFFGVSCFCVVLLLPKSPVGSDTVEFTVAEKNGVEARFHSSKFIDSLNCQAVGLLLATEGHFVYSTIQVLILWVALHPDGYFARVTFYLTDN